MIPKLASKGVFFEIQNVYSLCIVSKFNLEANLDSNGHPNETPNGVQNRGHELAVRASVRVGASGRAKPRSWSQFEVKFTCWRTDFALILGQFAAKNVSRIDHLCLCCYMTCTLRAPKTSAHTTHDQARWRNTRACTLDTLIYSSILYCNLLHCNILYCIIQRSIILYSMSLHSTTLCYTIA